MALQAVGVIGLEHDIGGRVIRTTFIASDPSRDSEVGKRMSSAITSVIVTGTVELLLRRGMVRGGSLWRRPGRRPVGWTYWNFAALSLVTISVPVSTLFSTVWPVAAFHAV